MAKLKMAPLIFVGAAPQTSVAASNSAAQVPSLPLVSKQSEMMSERGLSARLPVWLSCRAAGCNQQATGPSPEPSFKFKHIQANVTQR